MLLELVPLQRGRPLISIAVQAEGREKESAQLRELAGREKISHASSSKYRKQTSVYVKGGLTATRHNAAPKLRKLMLCEKGLPVEFAVALCWYRLHG